MPLYDSFIQDLKSLLGADAVLTQQDELLTYECDGFPIAKAIPGAVVFPKTTEQVSELMKLLRIEGVEIVPRGNGTGLTGGCVAFQEGVIVSTSRMTKIVDVDLNNRMACVEAGVRNLELSEYVQRMEGGERLHFSPDPSSQRASTIGGNAATNAGGLHTLKYGVTANHVLGMEIVLPDGQIVESRMDQQIDGFGPDLPGLLCASEGTLGIITKLWVKLVPKPESNFRTMVGVFSSSRDASQSVAEIIGAGIVPASMEMMDGAMVRVVEEAFHYGFPADAQALLLIEVDGIEAALDEEMAQVVEILKKNHADEVQASKDQSKRAELWSARRRAFGAIGRISPSYCTQDACVPRSMLPEVIDRIAEIGKKYDLIIANVFHAGDGNVHPILLFDEDNAEQVVNTMKASHDILEYCIEIGGAVTGEHGVGVEKLPMMQVMFDEPTMHTFAKLKAAFDPEERINFGKMIPSQKLQVDLLKPASGKIPGGAMAH